eukprot:CAMPEP_0175396662 /NCGR_PEP_ID=MMETSP0095-20121207/34569_1 /TAXON_ID=311494 /ORGANISM="Alexandrium monilatum, Strain CCMP3105" /LENGTH=159 /DNA_ID=CAMNT_0016695309 /DNA_START=6 /DNA_END=486 /DNA_ORIENTATION=-
MEAQEQELEGEEEQQQLSEESGDASDEEQRQLSMLSEDVSDEDGSEPQAAWRRRIKRHRISWPPPTVLDMEDHLSRAGDIIVFWFYEARVRADAAAKVQPLAEKEPLNVSTSTRWTGRSGGSTRMSSARQLAQHAAVQPEFAAISQALLSKLGASGGST